MRRVGTDARPEAESATSGVVWRGRSIRSCVVASFPEVAVGQFVVNTGGYGERERPIAPDILKPIAAVGARQRTDREHPRHEAQVGVRFTGRDELRHLVELGEGDDRPCSWFYIIVVYCDA